MKLLLSKIKKWFEDFFPDVKYNLAEKVVLGIGILLICGDIFYAWALSLDASASIDNYSELVLLGLAFTLFIISVFLATELSATYRALKKALKQVDSMRSSKETK